MKNKIFISGYAGYYNLGDDLMIELLSELLPPDSQKILLCKEKYYSQNYIFLNRYNLFKYFFLIKKNDILINLGGLFQDKTSLRSILYYFKLNILFLIKGGKISFINTDFSDIKYSHILIKYLLKKSILTILRSKEEYKTLQKQYPHVHYLPDMVFNYTSKDKVEKKSYTLISLNQASTKKEYLYNEEILADLKERGQEYKFLIMRQELKLFKQIKQHFSPDEIFIYKYTNLEKTIHMIRVAKNIITMRYHTGILGILFKKNIQILKSGNKINILNKDYNITYYIPKNYMDKSIKKEYIIPAQFKKNWQKLLWNGY